MIIASRKIDNIGRIRPKHLSSGQWLLKIYPPFAAQGVSGEHGHSHREITVDEAELARIERVAPHLLAGPVRRWQV